jgi:hypothetical protein
LIAGFTSVAITSGWAVNSIFGIGAADGVPQTMQCPEGTKVTGMSGGAMGVSPFEPPKSFLQMLQFYCSGEWAQLLPTHRRTHSPADAVGLGRISMVL